MIFIEYGIYLFLSLSKLYLFSISTGTEFSFGFLFLNLSSILLLSSWTLLLEKKKRRWVLLILLFLHSTLIISDLWYYRYFGDLLSVALLADVPQMTSVGGGFMTLVNYTDFFFFADLLIFSLAIFYLRKRTETLAKSAKRIYAGAGFLIGITLFIIPLTWSYIQQEEWLVDDPVSNMREYYQLGFWGYHGADILKSAGRVIGSGNQLTDEEEEQILQSDPDTAEAEEDPSSASPNIIVVQLESFQTSVIGQQVNNQELTPNLNALKEEMLYFPYFYHQTHEGRTSDAEFITLTSLHPIKSGSVYTQFAENEFNGLPEQLKNIGYDTAAMHAFEKDFWNRDNFYANIGIDQFFSEEDFPGNKKIGMALNDKDFFMTSIGFMDKLKEPYFAFMVALTSHTPYEFPEEKRQLDLSGYEDPLTKGYYETVHYVDGAVGTMVEELKRKDIWDDALVVFYGDHDSGLIQEGSEMAEDLNAETAVDFFELDHLVPLFIKPPNLEAGETMDSVGGQIDIAPTILDLLGIEPPFMLGQSLLDEKSNLIVFRDGSFRFEDLYYKPDLTEEIGSGVCYSVSTESELPQEQCESQIENATEQLRISDLIIEEDALDEIQDE